MRYAAVVAAVAALLLVLAATAKAEVYYHEKFETLSTWVRSAHKPDYGKTDLAAGEPYVDKMKETGLRLAENSKFYAISRQLPTEVNNADGKPFVLSFSVKNAQGLRCGGAYVKIMADVDQRDFHGESDYWLMFGPDRCGSTDLVHVIFNYDGKNLLWKKRLQSPGDKATHVYTLAVLPDNTFQVYVDGKLSESGSLEDGWDFLPPRMIADENDKKPADWVDVAQIEDPEDVKPEDWEDEPAVIPEDDAVKPDDWDDNEDGEWERPVKPNPKYRGEWHPRLIPNPAYRGKWNPMLIPNPAYVSKDDLYKMPAPMKYVGIEVLQVEGGSIFNNIVIGDNVDEVLAIVKATYGAMAEKEMELVKAAEEADNNEAKKKHMDEVAAMRQHREEEDDDEDDGVDDHGHSHGQGHGHSHGQGHGHSHGAAEEDEGDL